ncbi:MAG: tetratricopeptide repeat protein [Deltaproteobacteria bacterium]|nr:tetratricopeptide repeat protein [Deltaproteobacteria bacterium]
MRKFYGSAALWACLMFFLGNEFSAGALAEPLAPAEADSESIGRGIANLKEENYEEAIEDFKRAREEAPLSSIAAYHLGVAYKKTQAYKEAKIHLEDALKLSPAVKEAVLELADAYYQTGDNDAALAAIAIAEKENIQPGQTALLKGMVLIKTLKYQEAIEAFTKAKEADASFSQAADYQIGVANMQLGRLAAAKDIFKEIIIKDPNADISGFAKQYIDAISERQKVEKEISVTVGLQYSYDDNVLLKPGDSSFAEKVTNEADSSTVATLRAEYAPKTAGPASFKAQYSYYVNAHYKLASHDVQSNTVSLVPGYNMSGSAASLIMSYNFTMVDDDDYLQTYSVSPTYQLALGGSGFAQAFYRWQRKDYKKNVLFIDETKDGDTNAAGLSGYYLFDGNKGFVNMSYTYDREFTSGANWRYVGHKGGLGLLYPVTTKLKFNLSGEFYYQKFDKQNSVFLKSRRDRTYTGSALLSHPVWEDWVDFQLQYVFIRGDSNVAVYDYDKNVYTAGLEARF